MPVSGCFGAALEQYVADNPLTLNGGQCAAGDTAPTTFDMSVTNVGASAYALSGTDRGGTVVTSIRMDSAEAASAGVEEGPNETWKWKIPLALTADGASSQGSKTLDIKITSLGATDSANYRIVKTVANGNWFNGNAQALSVGENSITVAGVAFDRTVIIQFSADDIEFETMSVNSNSVYNGYNPTVNINVGDTVEFSVTATGHPFYIKDQQVNDYTTGNVAGVDNNGAQNTDNGPVSWTPTSTGTFYYVCAVPSHTAMVGQIIVS